MGLILDVCLVQYTFLMEMGEAKFDGSSLVFFEFLEVWGVEIDERDGGVGGEALSLDMFVAEVVLFGPILLEAIDVDITFISFIAILLFLFLYFDDEISHVATGNAFVIQQDHADFFLLFLPLDQTFMEEVYP